MQREDKKKPAMEVRGLYFSYGKNKVLRDASFTIQEGEITTIMGANGCGKSTLFNLMTKNLCPRKGNIFLGGRNIQNLALKEFARKVSIVHQYNTSADDITVERLVSFGRTPHMKMMQARSQEDEEKIRWAMEVTNVEQYRYREVGRLSGGQRQRVWIAMALVQSTKILFLDEPTTYLDIRYQIEILELVRRLNREYGITIIMVLHDINQAIHYSDRIIGLKDGRVAAWGAPEEIITPECIRELYGISLGVTNVEGRRKLYEQQKSDSFPVDHRGIYLSGTGDSGHCAAYPANSPLLSGHCVLLCEELQEAPRLVPGNRSVQEAPGQLCQGKGHDHADEMLRCGDRDCGHGHWVYPDEKCARGQDLSGHCLGVPCHLFLLPGEDHPQRRQKGAGAGL